MNDEILFYNPKAEFRSLYFDKLKILAVDKCLKVNKEFKIDHDSHDSMELIDTRNKHIEACYDKFFALHGIYDDELLKNLE